MPVRFQSAAQTRKAQIPSGRHDAVLRDERNGMFAVASGPPPVERSSGAQVFLDTLHQHRPALIRQIDQFTRRGGTWRQVRNVFHELFQLASDTIRQIYRGTQVGDTSGTVMLVRGGKVVVTHVGRTRGYLLRGGKVVRLTHDDGGGEEDVAPSGDEGATQMALQPPQSGGAGALGRPEPLKLDGVVFKAAPKSRILLVSEGVAGILRGSELLKISGMMEEDEGFASLAAETGSERQVVADSSALVVRLYASEV